MIKTLVILSCRGILWDGLPRAAGRVGRWEARGARLAAAAASFYCLLIIEVIL